MRKALVVTERGRLLAGLLAALGGSDLTVAAEASLAAAAQKLRTERIDLLVVDLAALAEADRPLAASLRAIAGESKLLVIVPADRPRLLRAALKTAPDGLLLDPFDLAEGELTIARLLTARTAALTGHESLDALATFLKGLAHEILNPLMGVSGILQLLRKDAAATPEVKARYEAMWQGAERIQKTMRELEYFVRARKPQRARFDPAQFVRELVGQWTSGDSPLQVSAQLPDSAPAILGDGEQLAAALRHLTRFAAGPDGRGAVMLALTHDRSVHPERIEIVIEGAAAVKLPPRPADLLIPYQDTQGTGRSGSLELAAAYGIFRSHRGTIEVSAAEVAAGGRGGVRFRALLPIPPGFSALGAEIDPAGAV